MGKKSSSSPPPPQQIDPGKAQGEYLFGKGFGNYQGVTDQRLQDKILAAEATNRPKYTALELADINTMAYGTDEQGGLIDLQKSLSQESGELQREQLQLQRESDVQALQEFAPQVVESYREADPYSTEMADLASQQAKTLYAEGEGELSPERRRMAEQAARQGSLARGREMDSSGIAGELLGREQVRSQLRNEARMAGGQAFGMNRSMAGDLGSTILGRPSQSIGLGGQMLGMAQQGAAGPMGPQLFDPNAGINMALQHQQNMTNYSGAMAQASASKGAGTMGMLGSIGGAMLGGPIGGAIGGAIF
ncbi:MAG: hypothetical protein KJO69_08775 [Gammaproteobacteria bacterium]|nr:hypothetical protein [Gammaproteobacteria bacterium]